MVRELRKATIFGAVGVALAAVGLAVSGTTPNVHNAVTRTAPHDIQAEPAITSSNGKSTIPEYEAEPAIVAMGGHPVPNPVAPQGSITGTADMCSGAPGQPPHKVQVRLLKDNRIIGHQTYLGNHAFRFSVTPGWYTVTSNQSYATSVHVRVAPGEAIHVEVYSTCS